MNIPKTLHVHLESPVSDSFYCKLAADSLDIDVEKKSVHELHIDNVNIPDKWNIGLIVGASGSGKTTLGKQLFGDDAFKSILTDDLPVIDQFPKKMTYDERAASLNGMGLNSVPCWIRPAVTLSNGQRARAEAALLMEQSNDIICIDEWTSVVDRTVAKAMSNCIHRHAKKRNNKKIILLSCHYDIIEWVNPDWLIDCNKQEFHVRHSENFFFSEREKLNFEIRQVDSGTWKYFSKYHYLSDRLPGGKIYCFGLFCGEDQIGFQCFANYVPHQKNRRKIMHSNRTVIHPDYNGLGLGIRLATKSAQWMMENVNNIRIMAKFSAVPMYKSRLNNPNWKFIESKRVFRKLKIAGNMVRRAGFREAGIKTYHFEYVGHRLPAEEREIMKKQ